MKKKYIILVSIFFCNYLYAQKIPHINKSDQKYIEFLYENEIDFNHNHHSIKKTSKTINEEPVTSIKNKENIPTKENIRMKDKDIKDMVFIERDDFVMGCTSEQGEDCETDEKITQLVKVDAFYISKTEVTVAQYEAFCKETKRKMPSDPDFNPKWKNKDHPIVNVDWNDADAYCKWAGGRLPTESEWEYAARGGKHRQNNLSKYSGTSDDNDITKFANYYDNSGDGTRKVATKLPNQLGIHDMSGNVYEWCSDWYVFNYKKYPIKDGTDKVIRGGSWMDYTTHIRTSYRFRSAPSRKKNYVGFRLCK